MNDENKATLLLLIGVIFWGMTFSLIKEAVQSVDAFSFVSVRFFIASIILTLVFLKKLKNYSMEVLKTGVFAGLLLAATLVFQTIGLQYTTASNAAFITGMFIVFVLIFVSLLDRKLPGLLQTFSVIMAFAGLALITINENLAFNIGDAWVLLCAIFSALHVIAISRLVPKLDASLFALTQFYTVAFVTLLAGLLINREIAISQSFPVWQAIMFCAVFATVYTYTIQAHFQKYLSEIKASVIFSFEPFFAAIFAFLYLAELLAPRAILGGVLIFAAMLLSEQAVIRQLKKFVPLPA
ncbi:MAG: DMT family transporter [Candidatus Micrarchaeota archaeon]|nr:DMT family transporter [Candidatus Micrarchaeota archaeon]